MRTRRLSRRTGAAAVLLVVGAVLAAAQAAGIPHMHGGTPDPAGPVASLGGIVSHG